MRRFFLDFLSVAPSAFDILPVVVCDFGGDNSISTLRVARVVRTTRLLKLLRLLRSSRLFLRWRTRMSIRFSTLTIIRVTVTTVVLTHWTACILKLQTVGYDEMDTWLGATGWCALDDSFGEGRRLRGAGEADDDASVRARVGLKAAVEHRL